MRAELSKNSIADRERTASRRPARVPSFEAMPPEPFTRRPPASRAARTPLRLRAPRALLAAALPLAALAGCEGAGAGNPPPAPSAAPAEALPGGPELVALYFGATTCRPCLRPEVKRAVREMRRHLEQRATESGRDFSSIGVALDPSVPAGVDFLAGTAEFDEIAVGRSWANAAAIEHLWGDPEAVPAIPQIVVLEREIRPEPGGRPSFGEPRVLRRVLGASAILRWVEEGAPLEER